MDGDKPVTRWEDDRLGFRPIAEHLAGAIVGLPAAAEFVFGIEGRWGSGKSTLISLTIEALSHSAAAPEIINFSPWLVGDRADLLQSIFTELARAAVKIDPIEAETAGENEGHWWSKLNRPTQSAHRRLRQKEQFQKDIKRKLERFGIFAGGIGKLARVAGILGVPLAEKAADILDRSGDVAKALIGPTSLSKEKAELVGALAQLSRRIIVFIDDLDRLEPREASEVLRLVRAVADFPNII
jgi:predicted KAP-like P-loop ATPase